MMRAPGKTPVAIDFFPVHTTSLEVKKVD